MTTTKTTTTKTTTNRRMWLVAILFIQIMVMMMMIGVVDAQSLSSFLQPSSMKEKKNVPPSSSSSSSSRALLLMQNNNNNDSVSISIPPLVFTVSTITSSSSSSTTTTTDDIDSMSTTTTSSSSSYTSGFMFDFKARPSNHPTSMQDQEEEEGVVLYGLDVYLFDTSSFLRSMSNITTTTTSNTTTSTTTTKNEEDDDDWIEVQVYTKLGSFRAYEQDESQWTHWFTTQVQSSSSNSSSSGNGDKELVPTALLASRGYSSSLSQEEENEDDTITTLLPSSFPTSMMTTTTTTSTSSSITTMIPTSMTTSSTSISDTMSSSKIIIDDDDDDNPTILKDNDDDDAINNNNNRRQLFFSSTKNPSSGSGSLGVSPIYLPSNTRLSIYITTPSGPYLRYYSTVNNNNNNNNRYSTSDVIVLDSYGAAKRQVGWDSPVVYPCGFMGGLHYYKSNAIQKEWHPIMIANTTTTTNNNTNTTTTMMEEEEEEEIIMGELLPSNWESPTLSPSTMEPTHSMIPTITSHPSTTPTFYPTLSPTFAPTDRPSWSPVITSTFQSISIFETADSKPVLVYAGNMFDLKGRTTLEITSIGLHTYLLSTTLTINIYIRSGGGSYVGYEDTLEGWELRGSNITIVGNGLGQPSYLPYGSFEPILIKEQEIVGVYITCTTGPYLRSSKVVSEDNDDDDDNNDEEDSTSPKPYSANSDMVLYTGVGKRYPIEMGGYSPRVFNGVFEYTVLSQESIPSPSPTITLQGQVGNQNEKDLRIENATFAPIADTYVQRDDDNDDNNGDTTTYGRDTQLMVDGNPQKVSFLYFDLSVLNGNSTMRRPSQVLKATLRLYSMSSQSMFGGYVDTLANVENDVIDEDTSTWTNTYMYAEREMMTTFQRMGQFRAVWPEKFYEMDITQAFRKVGVGGGVPSATTTKDDDDGTTVVVVEEEEEDNIVIPTSLLVRLSSDQDDGVMYRSREGDSDNGPRLFVTFAYNPDINKALAREFGSDPPTIAPTVLPVWEDAIVPTFPKRTYFNYDPKSSSRGSYFGPEYWENVESDGYYDQFRKLRTDTRTNRCSRGERQSPRDLCATTDKCLEFHQTRPRIGEYGLTDENWARPTPLIMHNKLRLQYPERRSEWDRPEPPGADFAHNVFRSGIQDISHIDLKVRSEHRLCGKQYDGEMQLFYLHREGNLEALSVLIEVDRTEQLVNGHFQVMLDYFQDKFDQDASLCQRRRMKQKARSLLEQGRRHSKELNTKLRGMSFSSPSVVGDEIDDDETSTTTTSLFTLLYQTIRDSFHRQLQKRRRMQRPPTWNPLEPWFVLKSVHFWGYKGSITEPPCFEEVNWRIVDVPMKIHFNQYLQLKRLMFDHVDPDTCRKTSTHYEESNARPVQPDRGGATYRCRRSDYASDMERRASGRVKGFVLEDNWWGVNNLPYVTPEFPNV